MENPKFTVWFPLLCFCIFLATASVVGSNGPPAENRTLILIEEHAKRIFGSNTAVPDAADSSHFDHGEEDFPRTVIVQVHEEEIATSAEPSDFISPQSEPTAQYHQFHDPLWEWNFPHYCCCAGYTLGKGVGYSSGYASLSLLTTSWRSREKLLQPFIDIRGHLLNNSEKAANIGMGALYYSSHLNMEFGGNIYYDFREGKQANYHQIGIGAEVFGSCWDFRINGYFPVGRRQASSSTLFDHYEGGFFAICTKEERSLAGCDAELGYYIRKRDACNPCDFDFYLAMGPYYFSKASCSSDVFGGLARFRVSWLNCINIELIASSDHVFHDRVQARFELCIPLGCGWKFWEADDGSCNPCCFSRANCCQRVQRRDIIAIKNSCRWCTNWGSSADSSCRISQCDHQNKTK